MCAVFSFLDLLTFVRRACSPSTVIRRIVDQRGEAIESAQSNIDASRQRLRQLINSITNSTTIDEYIFRVIKFDRWCGVFSICLCVAKTLSRLASNLNTCRASTLATLLAQRAHCCTSSEHTISHTVFEELGPRTQHTLHTTVESAVGDTSLTSPVQPLGLIRARQLSLRDNCPIEGSH